MSLQNTHIIQRSHLKIKVRDQHSAYDIQTRVIEAFESKGMLALEEEMDRLAPAGEIISLDSLRLDLGDIALDDLEDRLPQLLVLRLREAFMQAISDAGQEPKTEVKQADAMAADLALLLRFLEQGTAGWEISVAGFDASTLLGSILDAQPAALIGALRSRLQQRHVRERLSLQFAQAQILRILDLLQPHLGALAAPLYMRLEALSAELSVFPQSAARRKALVLNYLLALGAAYSPTGSQAAAAHAQVGDAWAQMLPFWVREEWISTNMVAFRIDDLALKSLLRILSKLEDSPYLEQVLMRENALKSIENELVGKYLVQGLQERVLAYFAQPQPMPVGTYLQQRIAAIAPLLSTATLVTVVEALELDGEQLIALAKKQIADEAKLRSESAENQRTTNDIQGLLDAGSEHEKLANDSKSKEFAAEKHDGNALDPIVDASPENLVASTHVVDALERSDLHSPKTAAEKEGSIQHNAALESSELQSDVLSLDAKSKAEKGLRSASEDVVDGNEKSLLSEEVDAVQQSIAAKRSNSDGLEDQHDADEQLQSQQLNQLYAQTQWLDEDEIQRLKERFRAFEAKIDAENRVQFAKDHSTENFGPEDIEREDKNRAIDENSILQRLKAQAEVEKGNDEFANAASTFVDADTEYDANKNPWIPKSKRVLFREREMQDGKSVSNPESSDILENQVTFPENEQHPQQNRRFVGSKSWRASGRPGNSLTPELLMPPAQAEAEMLAAALKHKKRESVARRKSQWAAAAAELEQLRLARIAAEITDAEEFRKAQNAKSEADAKWRDTQMSEQNRVRAVKTQPRMQASYPHPSTWGSDKIHYVNNAGLILLNPFFQPCFQDLGWLENGEFVDEEAQENAVLLMAWIASGDLVISEACLPLAKVMCGMEVGRPVRIEVDLPQRALDEATAMMEAAAGYWEKAGKLAPDQLRGSFLMRDGRLQDITSGWNLKVDRQTIDILLEFLPWGYGTIMLPWMRSLLTVDW